MTFLLLFDVGGWPSHALDSSSPLYHLYRGCPIHDSFTVMGGVTTPHAGSRSRAIQSLSVLQLPSSSAGSSTTASLTASRPSARHGGLLTHHTHTPPATKRSSPMGHPKYGRATRHSVSTEPAGPRSACPEPPAPWPQQSSAAHNIPPTRQA